MQLKQKVGELPEHIKFVKYNFTDMAGNIREVTLSRGAVKKDGIETVDGSSVFGKIIPPTESDMLLMPDYETLRILPWAKDSARVICDVYYSREKEGKDPIPFEGCPRGILKKIESSMPRVLRKEIKERFHKEPEKYHAHMAPELEFLLLPLEYDYLNIHKDENLRNTNYFLAPEERVDKALGQMLESLTELGIKKEKYHTEVTTYQVEIGMGHGNALAMADATVAVKYVIEKIAELNKLRASFIPKFRKGVNGSGMHVHQNLAATIDNKEYNLFYDESKKWALSNIGRAYIAGLLTHAKEITAITNPISVSYKRLVPGCEAPTYIAWDWKNRTALCRGHSQNTYPIRVEYRAPDPKSNPYLAFAAMLSAGLEGIAQNLQLAEPQKRDFYHDNKGVEELPGSLKEALEYMNQSKMLRKRMGNTIIDNIFKLGNDSWKTDYQEVTDLDVQRHF
jgi:glutamine synthetase